MSERERFEININEHVRVKLTELGRLMLERQHAEFWTSTRRARPAYKPPEEDAEGWSDWQLWCLMQNFGQHCGLGLPLPFETTIQVVARPQSGQAASGSGEEARSDERTGWSPGLLQDDSRELSRALASKPDAMAHARDAVAKIGQPEAPTADRRCQFCKGEASGSRCPTAEGCAAHGCHGECLPEDQEAPTAAALVPFGWVSTSPPKGMFTDEKDIADAWSNARINVVAVFAHPPARSGAGSEDAQPDRAEGA